MSRKGACLNWIALCHVGCGRLHKQQGLLWNFVAEFNGMVPVIPPHAYDFPAEFRKPAQPHDEQSGQLLRLTVTDDRRRDPRPVVHG
uniref:Putative secreted protein n=1 Tax=Ixodes ricinus TaxID=34613 RepID=A0A6B0U524_IXORI